MNARNETVHTDQPPLIALPEGLSDEAAAALLEWLLEAARLVEVHYAGQLHRHYHRPDPRQRELWDARDPPF